MFLGAVYCNLPASKPHDSCTPNLFPIPNPMSYTNIPPLLFAVSLHTASFSHHDLMSPASCTLLHTVVPRRWVPKLVWFPCLYQYEQVQCWLVWTAEYIQQSNWLLLFAQMQVSTCQPVPGNVLSYRPQPLIFSLNHLRCSLNIPAITCAACIA